MQRAFAGLARNLTRTGDVRAYVQDVVRRRAGDVRASVDDGAVIYVCGSLRGHVDGGDRSLTEILGAQKLQEMIEARRYRRDVY